MDQLRKRTRTPDVRDSSGLANNGRKTLKHAYPNYSHAYFAGFLRVLRVTGSRCLER